MRKVIVALAAALSAHASFADDRPDPGRFLVSYDVGALVSVGRPRNLLDDAVLVGLTGAYEVTPLLAVVGSFSRTGAETDGLWEAARSVYQYDLGVQVRYPRAAGSGVFLTPFAGAGVGGRSRDFRDGAGRRDADLTGYLAVGGRVEILFATVGLTARDYLSAPRGAGPDGGQLRNDLAVFASVSVRL